jgi:hypothetical protein
VALRHDPLRRKQKMLCENSGYASSRRSIPLLTAMLTLAAFLFSGVAAHAAVKQKTFATPEEAVETLMRALKADDGKELLAIFGPAGKELVSSGDPVDDRQRRETFLREFDRKHGIQPEGSRRVLIVGEKDWPFPIPLVPRGDRWIFDTTAGREEVLNRRIGENELSTIQTLLAVVDAQREYAIVDRDGDGIREYAEKFGSDPGRRNGLYWAVQPGEEPSPLGELVVGARAEGYSRSGPRQRAIPYHGYYFRILKKQGKHAPGGAYDYVVKKNMIGGFAVVAYPSEFGSSGIMTFIVSHEGAVYQKNLGKQTAKSAGAMDSFDPDPSWRKVD